MCTLISQKVGKENAEEKHVENLAKEKEKQEEKEKEEEKEKQEEKDKYFFNNYS